MTRQRNILLAVTVVMFLTLGAALLYRRVQFNRSNFRIGAVPQEIVNELIPKVIPVESIRPPALRQGDPLRYGSATSLISIIEYGDFQCDYCRKIHPEIKRVAEMYGGRVRFVWRDLPVAENHKEAMEAAVFARCAGWQGKFWETYDILMSSVDLSDKVYRETAVRLKLDPDFLSACRKNDAVQAAIRRDAQEARADGIQGVPFIFVGTKPFDGFVDAETLKQAVESSLSAL